jgi:uncharacterized protein
MFPSPEDLIFPVHAVPRPGPAPAGARPMRVEAPGGVTLHGLLVPPRRPPPSGERLLLMGFGGNAWNGQDVATYLHDLFPAAWVCCFHYRGYRPSGGRPSADALIEDAPLVLEAARREAEPDRTVLVGFSIGSAVAGILAPSADVDGAVLVTPFDSLKAVASDAFPFLPMGLLLRQDLSAAEALRGSDVPLAIVAAGRDELIPGRRTEALRRAAGNILFDRTIPRAGHNDVYARSDFHAAMRSAVGKLLDAAG